MRTYRIRSVAPITLLAAIALLVLTGFSAPALAQTKQITVTYMQSGTYDKAAEGMTADFEKKTGVKVKVVAFPWAVLRQNNTNDLLTGAAQYDAMSGGYYLADVYDKFAPLDDYITKSNYATGMIPGLLEVGKSEYFKGKHIGIPYGIDNYGLMANNDILKAAGVTPTFKTWDDFLAACKTITTARKMCPASVTRQVTRNKSARSSSAATIVTTSTKTASISWMRKKQPPLPARLYRSGNICHRTATP